MSENNKLDEKKSQPARPTGEEGVGKDRDHLSEIGSKQPDIAKKVGKIPSGQKPPQDSKVDNGMEDLKNS